MTPNTEQKGVLPPRPLPKEEEDNASYGDQGFDPATGAGYEEGGEVEEDPDGMGGEDPIQAALMHGRQMHGLPARFPGEEGYQGGNGQEVDPQALRSYLSGEGALPEEYMAALKAQTGGDPAAMVAAAGSPQNGFRVLQNLRAKHDMYMSAHKAASQRGDPNAGRYLQMAQMSLPGGGQQAEQSFDDGGEVYDDEEVMSYATPEEDVGGGGDYTGVIPTPQQSPASGLMDEQLPPPIQAGGPTPSFDESLWSRLLDEPNPLARLAGEGIGAAARGLSGMVPTLARKIHPVIEVRNTTPTVQAVQDWKNPPPKYDEVTGEYPGTPAETPANGNVPVVSSRDSLEPQWKKPRPSANPAPSAGVIPQPGDKETPAVDHEASAQKRWDGMLQRARKMAQEEFPWASQNQHRAAVVADFMKQHAGHDYSTRNSEMADRAGATARKETWEREKLDKTLGSRSELQGERLRSREMIENMKQINLNTRAGQSQFRMLLGQQIMAGNDPLADKDVMQRVVKVARDIGIDPQELARQSHQQARQQGGQGGTPQRANEEPPQNHVEELHDNASNPRAQKRFAELYGQDQLERFLKTWGLLK